MPANEPKNLHPFFERAINSTAPQGYLLSSDITRSAADFPRKLENEYCEKQIRPNDAEPHGNLRRRPRKEPVSQGSADGAEASLQSHDEQFKTSPGDSPICDGLNAPDGFRNLPMVDSRKRRKLSPERRGRKSISIDTLLAPAVKRVGPEGRAQNYQLQRGDLSHPNDDACSVQSNSNDNCDERLCSSAENRTDDTHRTPHINSPSQIVAGFLDHNQLTSVAKRSPEPNPSPQNSLKPILRLNNAANLESLCSTTTAGHVQDQTAHRRSRGQANSRKGLRLVVFKYGQRDKARRAVIGRQIDDIRKGSDCPERISEPRPVRLQEPSKPTHPFFLGKVSKQERNLNESEVVSQDKSMSLPARQNHSVVSFSTPGKMTYQAHKQFDNRLSEAKPHLQPRLGSPLFRLPGTVEPPWPARGFVNVGRPLYQKIARVKNTAITATSRKRKGRIIQVQPSEDVIRRRSARLFAASKHSSPKHLQQCPTRLLVSGKELQIRVLKNLKMAPDEEYAFSHHKLLDLFRRIESSMSSFDILECEGIPWTLKYAPKSTVEVLQSERDMQVLRSWLEGQAVVATDKGLLKQNRQPEDRRKHKKRHPRRSGDLDGFIVDGDEDSREMRDFSDDEISMAGGFDNLPRSLVTDNFGGDGNGKPSQTANAVLLSGPHGCGKTAAVFAAAKELCFEVFEIGPGSRRSGKDILDKVGDMALNHQVSKLDTNLASGPSPEDDALTLNPAEDRSTLTSFFSATPNGVKASKRKRDYALPIPQEAKKQASHQKQSLILLEEVDVLFNQDKQFWETVIDLAIQSKRPIIMTCSDESLVPWDEISLHAVLRLRPAKEALATKYLLLLAAVEGHLLSYEAVASLYRFRGFDLRASITDLDFWCQMAVGDQKDGMEWHLERWPPGVDLDAHGRKLRVVSESTLVSGIGVLGETKPPDSNLATADEELLFEAWAEWDLEPSHTSFTALDTLFKGGDRDLTHSWTPDHVDSLQTYEGFSSLISAVDVFSAVDLPSVPMINEILDATVPPISESHKANFSEGLRLLQADVLTDYSCFDAQATIFIHLGIKQLLTQMSHSTNPPESNCTHLCNSRQDLFENLKGNSRYPPAEPAMSATTTKVFAPLEPLRDDLHPSSLDHHGSSVIAEDIAPYVRSIAAYEIALENQRDMLLTSHDREHRGRLLRRTRASRSALEGNQRDTTRRERWFCRDMDLEAALQTGGSEWPRLAWNETTEKSELCSFHGDSS